MTVFANSLEISAKAQSCQVIADFPDTCFTPPQTPATPPGVPVPYPDFGQDSDLTSGSTTVKIGGKEISQENKSKYSKCSGDEAGAAPKKGVITSKNTGAVYAQKWSMDVKVQGKGVVRFTDLATSNHACNPGDAPPMVIVGSPAPPVFKTDNCLVGSYEDTQGDCAERGGQAHHIIPDEYLRNSNRPDAHAAAAVSAATGKADPTRIDDTFPTIEQGCCICVGGNAYGSTAEEAEPSSEQGKLNKATILAKGAAHAAATGGKNLATMRGHGFLHQFDDKFRKQKPTVQNALDTANKLLDEVVVYEGTPDAECVKKAKECIEKQMAPAKKKGAMLNQKTPRSAESTAKRLTKLKLTA